MPSVVGVGVVGVSSFDLDFDADAVLSLYFIYLLYVLAS